MLLIVLNVALLYVKVFIDLQYRVE